MDVIKIFNEVQKNIPTKLLMIGDGPEEKKLSNFQGD